MDINVTTSNYW